MAHPRSLARRALLRAGITGITGITGVTASAAAQMPTAAAHTADAADTGSTRQSDTRLAQRTDPGVRRELAALERRYDARLGVYARNTRTGATVAYRAGERYAFCSTFKALAVAAVLRDHRRCARLDKVVHYPQRDLLDYAPITEQHVDTGMTVRALAAAAIQYSDNTAANLLFREIGGPAGLTAFCRSIGDRQTRSDRWEPALSSAVPDDARDTTTPAALGRDFQQLMLGHVLRHRDRERLVTWLKGNTTSDERFRAGLPKGWVLGDKTGTGDYGVANNVGVAWTGRGTPVLLSAMSRKAAKDAPIEDALLADAARVLADALAPGE